MTDRGFTGQKQKNDLELIDYNARWYMGGVGRFISPDTIVPDPTNPQSLNRYSYVNNRPINFNDPSGHCMQMGINADGLCLYEQSTTITSQYDASKAWIVPDRKTTYRVVQGGDLFNSLEQMAINYNGGLDLSDTSLFQKRENANAFIMVSFAALMSTGGKGDAASDNMSAFSNTQIVGNIPAGERTSNWGNSPAKVKPISIESVPSIGEAGKSPGNRQIITNNPMGEARRTFDILTVNATSVNVKSNGAIVKTLPDGSTITFRTRGSRKSNYLPVVNVNDPAGIGYWGIKFEYPK